MGRPGGAGVPLDGEGVAVGDGGCGRELGAEGEGKPLVGEGGEGEVVGEGSDGRELGGEGEGNDGDDGDEGGDGSDGEDEEGIGICRGICRGVGRLTCAQLAVSASRSATHPHRAARTADMEFRTPVIAVSKLRARLQRRLRLRAPHPRGSTNPVAVAPLDSKQTCA